MFVSICLAQIHITIYGAHGFDVCTGKTDWIDFIKI